MILRSQFLHRLLAALLICAMAVPQDLAAGFLSFPQNETPYDISGNITQKILPNGIVERSGYDNLQWLSDRAWYPNAPI